MRILLAIFGIALCLSGAPVLSGPVYSVKDLGSLGTVSATGFDINNAGVVAGSAMSVRFDELAVTWTADGMQVLGRDASAAAINDAGVIAGTTYNGRSKATVWQNGVSQHIAGSAESYATGINNAGQVVGGVVRQGRLHPFIADSSGVNTIDTPGWWGSAYDVSNSGQVVGTYANGLKFRAFSWTDSGGVEDLGTLGGLGSYAMAVSDTGLIVGSSMVSTGYLHAFLYDDAMRDLGTLGGTVSAAYGINSLGHAIGLSFDGQGRQRAFVWHDGVMYDLNSLIDPASGWTLEAAYGINELGQIVGTGRNGAKHSAFVLDWHGGSSDDPAGAAVPEPGTGLLSAGAACVLAMVAALRRRRSFRAAD